MLELLALTCPPWSFDLGLFRLALFFWILWRCCAPAWARGESGLHREALR